MGRRDYRADLVAELTMWTGYLLGISCNATGYERDEARALAEKIEAFLKDELRVVLPEPHGARENGK